MIQLIKNNNTSTILETSAGNGVFVNLLKFKNFKNIIAIEKDKNLSLKNNFLTLDFFNYSLKNKFDIIIGNPPYVKYNKIIDSTLNSIQNNNEIDFKSIFDNRANLYQYFIYKSILHLKKNGELIFIVPREFLKSTSSNLLNKFIFEQGTITDLIDIGDKKIFKNANPNVIIFRFQKNCFKRKTKIYNSFSLKNFELKNFHYKNGFLYFINEKSNYLIKDFFYIKVGGASGANTIFEHQKGIEFVYSGTRKTGKTKKMIYNKYHPYLEQFKTILINRKIKKFNEKNWWEWGRKCYISDKPRIYVNCKTRIEKPFFYYNCKFYDGSILAIFPKFDINSDETLKKIVNILNNNINWQELGFKVDGRYIFSQRSLENALIPSNVVNLITT